MLIHPTAGRSIAQELYNHCQSLPVSRRKQLELTCPKSQTSSVHAALCSSAFGMEAMLRYPFCHVWEAAPFSAVYAEANEAPRANSQSYLEIFLHCCHQNLQEVEDGKWKTKIPWTVWLQFPIRSRRERKETFDFSGKFLAGPSIQYTLKPWNINRDKWIHYKTKQPKPTIACKIKRMNLFFSLKVTQK